MAGWEATNNDNDPFFPKNRENAPLEDFQQGYEAALEDIDNAMQGWLELGETVEVAWNEVRTYFWPPPVSP